MLDIVLAGLNHTTAPVELRERLAFTSDESARAVEFLHTQPGMKEALLFSTCNRVEVLMTAENGDEAVRLAKDHIARVKNTRVEEFENNLYIHRGPEAVRHIFRVASSLDSMVIGEPQILGQIKEAFKTTVQKKASGVILNRLFHRAFNVAKRVRTETGIGDSAVSISYAAIELAKKIFGSLDNRQVLLVGAGEMAELAVEHLIRNKVGDIYVANRTFERGVELAERFHGKALRFEEIASALETVDIIISSTGSPVAVITKDMVKGVIRHRRSRSLFFIDIAVPRDIDPDINKLNNCYVYDIDDLKGVIDDNLEARNKEAVKAERIVDEAVIRFGKWLDGLEIVPTIVDLREKMKVLGALELEKTLKSSLRHLQGQDRVAVTRMVEALLNKILHDPIQYLKAGGCHRDESAAVSLVRTLFNLDND